MLIESLLLVMLLTGIFLLLHMPPFGKIYYSSNIWQRMCYFVLFFASVFPIIERYFSFALPIRLGVIKAGMLTAILFLYLLSIFIGKPYKICRSLWAFIVIYTIFVAGFVFMLINDVIDASVTISFAFEIYMSYAYYILIVFFAYNEFKETEAIENMLTMVIYIAILMSVVGLIQFIVGPVILQNTGMHVIREGWGQRPSMKGADRVEDIDHFRVFSTLTDHQAYGAFLFIALVVLFYYMVSYKISKRNVLLSLFFIFSMLTTYSLTIFFAFLLFVLLFFSLKVILELKVPKKVILVVSLLMVLFIMSFSFQDFRELLVSRLNLQNSTLYYRLNFFRNGIVAFMGYPWGYGFAITKLQAMGTNADCFWMWTLLQVGVLLFFVYVLLYLGPIVYLCNVIRKYKTKLSVTKRKMAYVLLSLFMVNLLFLNFSNGHMGTGPNNMIFWILTGISLNKSFWTSDE